MCLVLDSELFCYKLEANIFFFFFAINLHL